MYISSYRKEILIITFVVRSCFVPQQIVIQTAAGGRLCYSTLVLKLPCYNYVLKSSRPEVFIGKVFLKYAANFQENTHVEV